MTEPNIKLSESLEILMQLQHEDGVVVLNGTRQITRTHLNRLLKYGYLQEVITGWYISSKPGSEGDTTVWYTSFWHFLREYLNARCGKENWCLSSEISLDIHSGKTTIPDQVIVRSPNGSNNVQNLMYGTSVLVLGMNLPNNIVQDNQYGLNMYSVEEALTSITPSYFVSSEISAITSLGIIKDSDKIVRILLENGNTTKAGRLAGAFRHIGKTRIADDIVRFMREMDYNVREENPFRKSIDRSEMIFDDSPYCSRIRMMWNTMRGKVLELFPTIRKEINIDECLTSIEENYKNDAYHSMSIEGYQISPELIERVRSGSWDPSDIDKDNRNALVARGYYDAFVAVKKSVERILKGEHPGKVVDEDHQIWYLRLWGQFAAAGLLKRTDLIGYRNHPVYIRGSRHTPLNPEAVRDAMATLMDLLKGEESAAVRAILGHFFWGYIHPYMDGNGRIGRFLMNAMLSSGGYGWVVIPMQRREEYMLALEQASINNDITPFASFIKSLMGEI